MLIKPYHFTMNPSTSNTAQSLVNADRIVTGAVIQARSTNSYRIAIGTSTAGVSSYGVSLAAGDSVSVSGQTFGWANAEINLRDFKIVASTCGDSLSVLYFKRSE